MFRYSDSDSDYLPAYSEDSTGVLLGLQPGSPDPTFSNHGNPTYSNHGNTVLPHTHTHPGGGLPHNHTNHTEEDNKLVSNKLTSYTYNKLVSNKLTSYTYNKLVSNKLTSYTYNKLVSKIRTRLLKY